MRDSAGRSQINPKESRPSSVGRSVRTTPDTLTFAEISARASTLLEAYSGIFFVKNRGVGAVILTLTFWVGNTGIHGLIGGLLGLVLIYFAKKFLNLSISSVFLVNCILIGLFEGFVYRLSGQSFLLLLTFCAITFVWSGVMEAILGTWNLPVLSIPFSFSAILFISSMSRFKNLEWHYLYRWDQKWAMSTGWNIADQFLKTLSSVIFIPNVSVGLALLCLLVAYSRIQSFFIVASWALCALFQVVFYGPEALSNGTWSNFNLMLIGLSFGGYFLTPSLGALGVTVLSIVFNFFSFQFFIGILPDRPELTHSIPYTLCTILMILLTRKYAPGLLNPYIGKKSEVCQELVESRKMRFGLAPITLALPLKDGVEVLQGFDGPWTHQGKWKYALDFVISDVNHRTYEGQGAEPESYFVYGKTVLSPCHGWVERVDGHLPDRDIGHTDHDHNWGNYVLIRTAGGLFVLLAHLRQNSLKVKKGDPVVPGQEIAEVGNSGYSPEPHLHLQVQKGPALGAETLPFQLQPYVSGNRVRFCSVPKEGERIHRATGNKTLHYALGFQLGQKLQFEQSGSSPRRFFHLTIEMDADTGRTYLADEKGGRVYYWKDGEQFYFYDLVCRRGSPLADLMCALPIVPLTFGRNYRWYDHLPISVGYHGLRRILVELLGLFGLARQHSKGYYQMHPTGMRIKGRIQFFTRLEYTEVEIDPQSGIAFFRVGPRSYRRLDSENRRQSA